MVGDTTRLTESPAQYEFINPDPCGLVEYPELAASERQEWVRAQMPPALVEAFAAMRDHRLITDEGTSGCFTCGGTRLANHVADLVDTGITVNGFVSFTNQASFNAPPLRYGPVGTQAHGEIGLETEAVGEIVCSILDDVEVDYTWSGDGSDTIRIQD